MARVTLRVRGRIKVESWTPDEKVLLDALADDPAVRKVLRGVADEVVIAAKSGMRGNKPPPNVKYRKVKFTKGKGWGVVAKKTPGGTFFSAAPSAIADDIKVKDIREFKTGAGRGKSEIAIALVVADNPYTKAYENGGYGIAATKFFRAAANKVASRYTWVSRKRGLRKI